MIKWQCFWQVNVTDCYTAIYEIKKFGIFRKVSKTGRDIVHCPCPVSLIQKQDFDNTDCRKRRAESAGKLLQSFSIHSLPRLVFQDENDFSLRLPTNCQNNRVYFNGPKKDVQPERLYSEGNKFLKKVMVSAVITWKGVSQPFFIGGNGIKANGASYLKHLRDDLIPATEAMYTNKDLTFVQDSAPSHRVNQV